MRKGGLFKEILNIVVALSIGSIYAQDMYRVTPPLLLHTDAQMDDVEDDVGIPKTAPGDPPVDHPWWAVKENGKLRIANQWVHHLVYFRGSIKERNLFQDTISGGVHVWDVDPTQKPISNIENILDIRNSFVPINFGANRLAWTYEPNESGEGILNVYFDTGNGSSSLLGIVHWERTFKNNSLTDRLYAIGIAYSNDYGTTWVYCGDIIYPYHDEIDDRWPNTQEICNSNIGGGAYLIIGEYIYVYFNEISDVFHRQYPSVARANLAYVLADARNHTVNINTEWKKYSGDDANGNPMFNQNTFTGKGAQLTTLYNTNLNDSNIQTNGFKDGFIDLHCNAALCSFSGRYILTYTNIDYTPIINPLNPWLSSIMLSSSDDGIHWEFEKTVAGPSENLSYVYPSIISEYEGASNDNHIVGREFHVMFAARPRYDCNSYTNFCENSLETDLYTIHVNRVNMEAINLLLLD